MGRGTAGRVRESSAERHVGIRDLKARLSEYVRIVRGGGTVIVTEHGRPVARLVPEPVSLEERVQALARAGEIVWNGQRYTGRRPSARVRGTRTLSSFILEERDRG